MIYRNTCKIFTASMAGALFCAFLYTVMVKLTLPPHNLVHDLPLHLLFLDPFVITIGGFFAVLSGLIVFPVNLFLLKNISLHRAGIFTLLAVSLEIITVSLIWNAPAAWLSSYAVYLAVILFIRFSKLTIFKEKQDTASTVN